VHRVPDGWGLHNRLFYIIPATEEKK